MLIQVYGDLPSGFSIFREVPLLIMNFVHDCGETTHFWGDELGKKSLVLYPKN